MMEQRMALLGVSRSSEVDEQHRNTILLYNPPALLPSFLSFFLIILFIFTRPTY